MRTDSRVFSGSTELESALDFHADRLRHEPNGPFSRSHFRSPESLFKDLVLLFHEQAPARTGTLPDHAWLIDDVESSFHRELERVLTRNDLARSIAMALEIIRAVDTGNDSDKSDCDSGNREPSESGSSENAAVAGEPVPASSNAAPPSGPLNPPAAISPSTGPSPGVTMPSIDAAGREESSPTQATTTLQREAQNELTADQLRKLHERLNIVTSISSQLTGIIRPHSARTIQHPDMLTLITSMMEIFSSNPDLIRILELMGKLDDCESERNSRGVHPPHGELYDIELGNNLNRVIPSEFALLSDEDAELEFYRRYSEGILMQYAQRPRPNARGPICVCIDRSGSMHGQKTVLARACALFAINKALAQGRDACAITFSEDVTVYEFPATESPLSTITALLREDVVEGNNYTAALKAGVKQLKKAPFKGGDILLIGDAIETPTDKDMIWYKKFKLWCKKTDTRMYTIHIGDEPSPLLRQLRLMSKMMLRIPDVDRPELARTEQVIQGAFAE